MRIAVGGFQHETNTFAPSKADLTAFLEAGGWPGLTRGEALFSTLKGMNIPFAGFMEAARHQGHSLVPLTWANATPSAHVTEEAFERITGQILEDLRAARTVEAVYLDLHGAMVTEHLQDGEGEILRRVRAVIGEDVPLVASLDLHANVTPEMVRLADALVAYRSYPHVDMAETGERAARLMELLLSGRRLARAFRQLPFLIPLTSGCTLVEPAKSLYGRLPEMEGRGVASLSFPAGFGPADIYHCGPCVLAYGEDEGAVRQAAERFYGDVLAEEEAFAGSILSAADAVAAAIRRSQRAERPIVLADTQDNPGAGGNGDTVGLLEELVRQRAKGAVLGLLIDPAAAEAAWRAGEGARFTFALGAKSRLAGQLPFKGDFLVKRLGDGAFTCTGPFYGGSRMQLGPMALLEIEGVEVAVASRKVQAADQEMFRHLGVEPGERRILALKSSVHFRADFQPIAAEVIVAAAPGPNPVDHRALAYRNLRGGVRLMPRGPLSKGPGVLSG